METEHIHQVIMEERLQICTVIIFITDSEE